MPKEAKELEGIEELQTEATESEAEESEATENVEPGDTEQEGANDEEGEEVVVTFGDEEPAKEETTNEAPNWVKELRKAHREAQRENRELKAQLEASQKPKQVEVGAKPKLADFDYDEERFETELSDWYDRKRKADQQAAELEQQRQAEQDAWQEKLNAYETAKQGLKVKDFEDAESAALESLDQTQQGIIVQGADNPALVVYALGRNPDKIQELSKIKDPVKFAFTVAKLEKDLRVKNRKAPPPPERQVSGTAPKAGSVDSTLERLREDAAKTGDYTKVRQYKQQRKAK